TAMEKDYSSHHLTEAVDAFVHHTLWGQCKRSSLRIGLTGLALLVLFGLRASVVQAQTPTPTPSPSPTNPCPAALMPGQSLIPVPVLDSSEGRLRGTIILSDEQQWMTFRVPPS